MNPTPRDKRPAGMGNVQASTEVEFGGGYGPVTVGARQSLGERGFKGTQLDITIKPAWAVSERLNLPSRAHRDVGQSRLHAGLLRGDGGAVTGRHALCVRVDVRMPQGRSDDGRCVRIRRFVPSPSQQDARSCEDFEHTQCFAPRGASNVSHLKLVREQHVMRPQKLRDFLLSRHLFAGGRSAHQCRYEVPPQLRPSFPLNMASSSGVAIGSRRCAARLSRAKLPRWALTAARQGAQCTTSLHRASSTAFRRIPSNPNSTKPPLSAQPKISPRSDLRLTFTRQDEGLGQLPARLPLDASGINDSYGATTAMEIGTASLSLLAYSNSHPPVSRIPL